MWPSHNKNREKSSHVISTKFLKTNSQIYTNMSIKVSHQTIKISLMVHSTCSLAPLRRRAKQRSSPVEGSALFPGRLTRCWGRRVIGSKSVSGSVVVHGGDSESDGKCFFDMEPDNRCSSFLSWPPSVQSWFSLPVVVRSASSYLLLSL
jgi:hypothetical protein